MNDEAIVLLEPPPLPTCKPDPRPDVWSKSDRAHFEELEREWDWRIRSTQSFESYVRAMSGPDFEWSWHHEQICDALTRWANREPGWARLAMFLPPRHSKTELIGRLLPGYCAGRFASARHPQGFLYVTHTEKPLAQMINRQAQERMRLPTFMRLFPDAMLTGADGRRDEGHVCNQETWEFLLKGERGGGAIWKVGLVYVCLGVQGAIPGLDGHFVVGDDIVPSRDIVESLPERERLWNWWAHDLQDRLQPDGRLLLTMTRWHEDDPSSRLLQQIRQQGNPDGWKILTYPAIMDREAKEHPDRVEFMPFEDPRDIGEVLWPGDKNSRYAWPREKLEAKRRGKLKGEQGETSYDWDAKFMCRPHSAKSRKIQRGWFRICRAVEGGYDETTGEKELTNGL